MLLSQVLFAVLAGLSRRLKIRTEDCKNFQPCLLQTGWFSYQATVGRRPQRCLDGNIKGKRLPLFIRNPWPCWLLSSVSPNTALFMPQFSACYLFIWTTEYQFTKKLDVSICSGDFDLDSWFNTDRCDLLNSQSQKDSAGQWVACGASWENDPKSQNLPHEGFSWSLFSESWWAHEPVLSLLRFFFAPLTRSAHTVSTDLTLRRVIVILTRESRPPAARESCRGPSRPRLRRGFLTALCLGDGDSDSGEPGGAGADGVSSRAPYAVCSFLLTEAMTPMGRGTW